MRQRNLTVRLMVLLGRFEYAERGILDRTHLRFYTRSTIRKLIEDEGYQVLHQRMTNLPLEVVLSWRPESLVMRAMDGLLRIITQVLPNLFGYQVMVTARRK